ncbi:2-oxo acid dehydrogenase subunit E2 [Oceanimonas doudoroffii]|uniref:Dihydrolipoamide acetyltransferase component of pyruvate dehydrogenase complex n=1 Tax=Oceanimonas doudoroffii TaxID=84158 RepID=A0A233REE1_9GAMM|nr:2-oxo acid dehydrogenase subunit E2 [Oceanimonas doudoroffii]OXY81771.1 dihydrolipoamide acetyltransferase [Oceanimonas doudoroffii]
MKKDFLLPDIGEGIVECELVEWLVAEGDRVEEDQAICDVMTDKALVQIPAVHAGTISRLYVKKGDMARVDAPLFEMTLADDEATASVPRSDSQQNEATENAETSEGERSPGAGAFGEATCHAESPEKAFAAGNRAVASPAVRRLAREHNVDLAQVPGSGDKGRVYKEDVEAWLAAQGAPSRTESAWREPLSGVRAAMARHMTDSLTVPRFTYCEEFCLDELLALKYRLTPEFERDGVKLTLLPFFIKALSLALSDFPLLGARLEGDGRTLVYEDGHHVGVAVDTPTGLLVPVLHHCEDKSLLTLARELTRLTEAARAGSLSQAELAGATISLSNIGVLGGTVSTPIVTPPQLAIAALGRLQRLPRFDEQDRVVARQLMTVCWSADHRVIDGATLARFNRCWQGYLEQPGRMLARLH